MKDTITDANFPRTADGRVYHLGLRFGEVANRIITVGSPSRADAISTLLDGYSTFEHEPRSGSSNIFRLSTERGFLTITGRYKGVPVSIVSIGMGYPNMDFFVREVRECVHGDMVVVRLGSCGGLSTLPVGSIVVPTSSVAVRRNYDFDFSDHGEEPHGDDQPYLVSKPVSERMQDQESQISLYVFPLYFPQAFADAELHTTLAAALRDAQSASTDLSVNVVTDTVNASADSFYSSQGRQTSFSDRNETLVDQLLSVVPKLASLEMETFHLLHLASSWYPRSTKSPSGDKVELSPTIPPSHLPATPAIETSPSTQPPPVESVSKAPRIRAAAVQMIFANRVTQDFITPETVKATEAWSGRAVLDALASFPIPPENLHEENGSVWESK